MIPTDPARLFEMPGPFVSLYLDTTGNLTNPQARVSLRWKTCGVSSPTPARPRRPLPRSTR